MAVNDHGIEALKKAAEQMSPGNRADYYIKVKDIGTSSSGTVTGKILGKGNPGPVNTVLYALPAATTAFMESLVMCNTTLADRDVRVFLAEDGVTFDPTTALFYDMTLLPAETKTLELGIPFSVVGSSLAVYADTTGVTFTMLGVEIT